MSTRAEIASAALSGAREILKDDVPPAGRKGLSERLLACAALCASGLVPVTSAYELAGVATADRSSQARARLLARGISQLDVDRLTKVLADAGLTPAPKTAEPWSPERLALLKSRVDQRWSARDIAVDMNLSRGAVASKVAYMGWKLAGETRSQSRTASSPPAPRAKSGLGLQLRSPLPRAEPRAPVDPIPPASARPWEERGSRQCCFPYSTAEGLLSCCAAVPWPRGKRGLWLYCDEHMDQMFEDPATKARRSWKPDGSVPINFSRAA